MFREIDIFRCLWEITGNWESGFGEKIGIEKKWNFIDLRDLEVHLAQLFWNLLVWFFIYRLIGIFSFFNNVIFLKTMINWAAIEILKGENNRLNNNLVLIT